jgi:hypothetical protein
VPFCFTQNTAMPNVIHSGQCNAKNLVQINVAAYVNRQ